jgi:hypothetical protein
MRAGRFGRSTSNTNKAEGQELNTELTKDTETTEKKVTSDEMKRGAKSRFLASLGMTILGVGRRGRKSTGLKTGHYKGKKEEHIQ